MNRLIRGQLKSFSYFDSSGTQKPVDNLFSLQKNLEKLRSRVVARVTYTKGKKAPDPTDVGTDVLNNHSVMII